MPTVAKSRTTAGAGRSQATANTASMTNASSVADRAARRLRSTGTADSGDVTRRVCATAGGRSAAAPVTLPHVRIARFVTPGPATGSGMADIRWGVVEGSAGAALSGLTVAAIADHPFGAISFTGDRWALPDVRLLPPILPSKVVGIGKNYGGHVKEMGGDAPPETPIIFLKPSTAVMRSGRSDPVARRRRTGRPRGRVGNRDRAPAEGGHRE